MTTATGFRVSLGGTAAVFCVHDREKRKVVTAEHVSALGPAGAHGYAFECGCCENLFVDQEARDMQLCHQCRLPAVHPLGATG